MKCNRQFAVKLKDTDYFVLIGCGKCPACLMHKQQVVALRLGYDLRSPRCLDSLFVTLTYDDEHLERDVVDTNTGEIYPLPSVNPETIRNYLKRVRKSLDYDATINKLAFYLSAEYGDITKRPHYHAIMYILGDKNTCKVDLKTALKENWHMCNWSQLSDSKCFQSTNSEAARMYTAKHQTKRCQGIEGQHPNFHRMSQGYGSEFFTQYPSEVDFLKRNGYLYSENKYKVPAPRYYLEKLGIIKDQLEVMTIDKHNREIEDNKITQFCTLHRIRDPSDTTNPRAVYYIEKNKKIEYESKYFDIMYKKLSLSNKI